jgi:ElaB/YqjD/DUF883 family membrane-anchored ribosome-binding protein
MTEHETHASGAGDSARAEDPDELRQQIAATREDLGATVQALADKADVKTRARELVDERKQQAEQAAGQAVQEVRRRPLPFATMGALLAGMLIGAFLRRKR